MNDDAEIAAMQTIHTTLKSLDDPDAVGRVLRWAIERFQVERVIAQSPAAQEAMTSPTDNVFSTVADLFDAASPENEAEKALVVAYWFQEIQLQPEVDAHSINAELRNLGHGVLNVTRALGRLSEKRPRLLIQTKKAGSSQQARKRYRVTVEGIRHVGAMIGARTAE